MYIAVLYNWNRRRTTLVYHSPTEYEQGRWWLNPVFTGLWATTSGFIIDCPVAKWKGIGTWA